MTALVGWFVPAPHRSGSRIVARHTKTARLVGADSRIAGGGGG